MRMRMMNLLLLLVVSVLWAASPCLAADKFHAKLSGGEETPAVKTKAKAKAEFMLSKDGKELSYQLTVKDIKNPSAAHIHKGKKGESGPPLVGLFGGPKREGKVSGLLAQGIISEKNLIGELQGKTLGDLVALIKAGGAYVNVHTDAFPDGEIRGQIK